MRTQGSPTWFRAQFGSLFCGGHPNVRLWGVQTSIRSITTPLDAIRRKTLRVWCIEQNFLYFPLISHHYIKNAYPAKSGHLLICTKVQVSEWSCWSYLALRRHKGPVQGYERKSDEGSEPEGHLLLLLRDIQGLSLPPPAKQAGLLINITFTTPPPHITWFYSPSRLPYSPPSVLHLSLNSIGLNFWSCPFWTGRDRSSAYMNLRPQCEGISMFGGRGIRY